MAQTLKRRVKVLQVLVKVVGCVSPVVVVSLGVIATNSKLALQLRGSVGDAENNPIQLADGRFQSALLNISLEFRDALPSVKRQKV